MGDVGKWRVDGVACGLARKKKTKYIINNRFLEFDKNKLSDFVLFMLLSYETLKQMFWNLVVIFIIGWVILNSTLLQI